MATSTFTGNPAEQPQPTVVGQPFVEETGSDQKQPDDEQKRIRARYGDYFDPEADWVKTTETKTTETATAESSQKTNNEEFKKAKEQARKFFDFQELLDQEEKKDQKDLQKIQAIKKIQADVESIIEMLIKRKQFTQYALINWTKIYAGTEKLTPEELQKVFTSRTKRLDFFGDNFDKGMTVVYFGLNFLGLLVTLSKICTFDPTVARDLQDEVFNVAAGSAWNYWDACGGMALGIRQYMQGERLLGLTNFAGSFQLTVCTALANLSTFVPSVGSALGITAVTAGNLMGFSFAACMFASMLCEIIEAEKCEQRVVGYQEELADIEKTISEIKDNKYSYEPGKFKDENSYTQKAKEDLDKAKQQSILIQKSILFERAQAENHRRLARSWFYCGLAMTAIALSVSTLGVGLAAFAIGVACGGVVTGLIRIYANYKDSVKKATAALEAPPVQRSKTPPDQERKQEAAQPLLSDLHESSDVGLVRYQSKSLFDQLQDAIDQHPEIQFDRIVNIPGRLHFNSVQITFRSYLLDLLVTAPDKGEKIINVLLTNDQDSPILKSALKKVLCEKQHCSPWQTRGEAIYEKLYAPLSATSTVKVDTTLTMIPPVMAAA